MLLTRPETTRLLLDAIEASDLSAADLTLVQRQSLAPRKDGRIRTIEFASGGRGVGPIVAAVTAEP